jgi:hypothetical protein
MIHVPISVGGYLRDDVPVKIRHGVQVYDYGLGQRVLWAAYVTVLRTDTDNYILKRFGT